MSPIQKWLKDNKIIEVECLIADMTGTARGKLVSADKIGKEVLRISEGTLLQDVLGGFCDQYEEIIDAEDRDMVLIADPKTLKRVPWASKPTAQMIHDCQTLDGQMHPLSSRNVLRRVLVAYQKMGVKPVVAAEVEFYLIDKNTDPDKPLLSPVGRSGRPQFARQPGGISALNEYQPIIDTLYEFCEAQDLKIETLVHELGTAQLEINFTHGDPLDMADKVFSFKRSMREAAFKHGVYATFMAKPMRNQPGSSMHLHQSLVDIKSGKNIFCDSDGKHSELFTHYLGGLQKYTPNLISFYAPNVNSYRRFAKHNSAPVNLHWALDNRTVGFRVPKAVPAATRIENRFAGVDVNPYLAIAASLASGLAGIQNKMQPSKAYKGNAGDEEITVSRSLEEALRGLTNLPDVVDIIGSEFINAYRLVKLEEFEQYNRVISSWEREHLLLNV
ncbi:MAG: glutamine synthetase family protein [Kangiellaceae bacterium]|nr:glutamine synthetase family protein [Kangiellaceae bacterium]